MISDKWCMHIWIISPRFRWCPEVGSNSCIISTAILSKPVVVCLPVPVFYLHLLIVSLDWMAVLHWKPRSFSSFSISLNTMFRVAPSSLAWISFLPTEQSTHRLPCLPIQCVSCSSTFGSFTPGHHADRLDQSWLWYMCEMGVSLQVSGPFYRSNIRNVKNIHCLRCKCKHTIHAQPCLYWTRMEGVLPSGPKVGQV